MGHQRLLTARRAGLASVWVVYRRFPDPESALFWAAEQQANRRNASREAQCLSVLRALRRMDAPASSTKEVAARFGFGPATVDRARQALKRRSESEIADVLDGTRGPKTAYNVLLARERAEKSEAGAGRASGDARELRGTGRDS